MHVPMSKSSSGQGLTFASVRLHSGQVPADLTPDFGGSDVPLGILRLDLGQPRDDQLVARVRLLDWPAGCIHRSIARHSSISPAVMPDLQSIDPPLAQRTKETFATVSTLSLAAAIRHG